jgi:hypothetical protein
MGGHCTGTEAYSVGALLSPAEAAPEAALVTTVQRWLLLCGTPTDRNAAPPTKYAASGHVSDGPSNYSELPLELLVKARWFALTALGEQTHLLCPTALLGPNKLERFGEVICSISRVKETSASR